MRAQAQTAAFARLHAIERERRQAEEQAEDDVEAEPDGDDERALHAGDQRTVKATLPVMRCVSAPSPVRSSRCSAHRCC